MKKLLLILTFILSSFVVNSQQTDIIPYQNWKIVYDNNCDKQISPCVDFYYAITRSKTKIYNAQYGKYYYYYYLVVQSNSTYRGGGWAYTKLTSVNFYMNGRLVHSEQYVLFREQKTICVFWHPSDANAQLSFDWQNISLY
jgi:hypothetical protein